MKSFWDRIAPLYDISESFNGRVYSKMLGYAKSLVPFGSQVLECAAGTGEISLAVAYKADHILCTDMSENMLKTAKRKCASRGIDNISFEQKSIFDLGGSDEVYDIVIAANVLHLVENPRDAVRELMRVLKKGGRLIIPVFITLEEDGKPMPAIKVYKLLGFNPAAQYTPQSYCEMLKHCNVSGKIKVKLIDGFIPSAFAVIEKY